MAYLCIRTGKCVMNLTCLKHYFRKQRSLNVISMKSLMGSLILYKGIFVFSSRVLFSHLASMRYLASFYEN